MSGYARLTGSSSAQAVRHQKATYGIQVTIVETTVSCMQVICTIVQLDVTSFSNRGLLAVPKQLDQWIPPRLHSRAAAAAAIHMKWNWSCVTIGIARLPWQARPTSHLAPFHSNPRFLPTLALPDQSIHPPVMTAFTFPSF